MRNTLLLLPLLLTLGLGCQAKVSGGDPLEPGDDPQLDGGNEEEDGDGGGGEEDGGSDGGEPDGGEEPEPDAGIAGVPHAYVSGTHSVISVFKMNKDTGALTASSTVSVSGNPSFLAVSPDHRFLFAVADSSGGTLRSYGINASTGALTSIDSESSSGAGPTHLSTDATGKWLLAANYTGNSASVLPVSNTGQLSPAVTTVSPGLNAHQILTDPSNKYAFVPCLGSDHIAQYLFNATTGALTPNAVPTVSFPEDSGPRHLAFHPTKPMVYVVNELAVSMTALSLDSTTGRLTSQQTLSMLPVGNTTKSSGAEVQVHPSGRFLYGSVRGRNELAIYTLNATTGLMTFFKHVNSGGGHPRHFSLDPSGNYLYVANRDANSVQTFRVNTTTGDLTAVGTPTSFPQPHFVGVVYLQAP